MRGVVDGGREVGISSPARRPADRRARGPARARRLPHADRRRRRRQRAHARVDRAHDQRARTCSRVGRAGRGATAWRTLKLYMMVGLPGETDADIDELVRFDRELAAIDPRVALGVAPFVAKRNTPLDGAPFAGIDVVERRLAPPAPRACAGAAPRCARPRRAGPGSSTCSPRATPGRAGRAGRLARRRHLRRLEEGVRRPGRRADRPARPRPLHPGAGVAPSRAARSA